MLSISPLGGNGGDKSGDNDKSKNQLIFKIMIRIATGLIYFDNQIFSDFNEIIHYIENLIIDRQYDVIDRFRNRLMAISENIREFQKILWNYVEDSFIISDE